MGVRVCVWAYSIYYEYVTCEPLNHAATIALHGTYDRWAHGTDASRSISRNRIDVP